MCAIHVNREQNCANKERKITIRKFKESAIIEFEAWLVNSNWSDLLKISNVNQNIAYFVNNMYS